MSAASQTIGRIRTGVFAPAGGLSRFFRRVCGLLTASVLVGLFLLPKTVYAEKAQITFDGWDGPSMRVFLTRPERLADDTPVVFVMHGVRRNADEYRDQWHDLAIQHEFLLVVPEFSQEDFPGSRGYNLGHREDEKGNIRPKRLWAYSAIEAIFDDVRQRHKLRTARYALYGHSAGAQFVHRFIYYMPEARVSQIVPANAGWYLSPVTDAAYPYGLHGASVTADMLTAAWAKPVTVLLGELDTDPEHRHLRRAPEAMVQGSHRFARGQHFFDLNQQAAQAAASPFQWRLATVPGVGHENRRMAPAAIPYLLP